MGMMSTHPNLSPGNSSSMRSITRNKGIQELRERQVQPAARPLLVANLPVTPLRLRLRLPPSGLFTRYCILWSVISCAELIYPERSCSLMCVRCL